MAAKKPAKQPTDSKQLKQEVAAAVKEAKQDVSTGNVATADEPEDTVDHSYQGHSHPNP